MMEIQSDIRQWLCAGVIALAFAAPVHGQTPNTDSSAPSQQPNPDAGVSASEKPTNATADSEKKASGNKEPVTILPHSDESLWWVSGQVNVVFQAHPAFHAPYSGPNSLHPQAEHATSRVLTLYTGLELRRRTEILFDIESAGGRGISDALGVAGFTNVDVVRNPSLGSKPYIARAMVRHIIPLGNKRDEDAERGPLSVLRKPPVDRLEFRFGKMSLADFFDTNDAASDSHLQLLNWTTVNNGAYDYAADTRGYTFAFMAELQHERWGIRFAEALMPKVANGPQLDWDLRRARSENVELELRPALLADRKTTLRLLTYVNHANMGSYREAISAFLAGTDPRPIIEQHRRQGRIKYGFGANLLQQLSANTRGFMRSGWNEGQNESFAYTEVDGTLESGADYAFARWRRPNDRVALAFVTNGISRLHQQYLALGGNGFLLGDGRLDYGRENILESYYTAHLWRGFFVSPLLQFIVHPGYNRDRGPVLVPGLRLHLDL